MFILYESLCTVYILMFPQLIWTKINEIEKFHAYHIYVDYKTVGPSIYRAVTLAIRSCLEYLEVCGQWA